MTPVMTAERRARVAGGAAGLGAALAGAVALIASWEGLRRDPYRDIVGVATVCYGETRAAPRRHGRAECEALLRRAVENDFAPAVRRAVPAIADHPGPYVASISLAYNIGAANFARSTVARRFNAGDWRGGCEAFAMWTRAGGRFVPGLARRRAAERAICLGAR